MTVHMTLVLLLEILLAPSTAGDNLFPSRRPPPPPPRKNNKVRWMSQAGKDIVTYINRESLPGTAFCSHPTPSSSTACLTLHCASPSLLAITTTTTNTTTANTDLPTILGTAPTDHAIVKAVLTLCGLIVVRDMLPGRNITTCYHLNTTGEECASNLWCESLSDSMVKREDDSPCPYHHYHHTHPPVHH